VRPAALSNASPIRSRMNIPSESSPHPQPDFACGGCAPRLSNKINAAGSTNPLIWTALTLSRPFGTQFVSRVFTQTLKPTSLWINGPTKVVP
jgi:hypothetical protein